VFYRVSAQMKARELGLSGWARNRDDGRVELVACGQQQMLQALLDWLWQGSRHARVEKVEVFDSADCDHSDFCIR